MCFWCHTPSVWKLGDPLKIPVLTLTPVLSFLVLVQRGDRRQRDGPVAAPAHSIVFLPCGDTDIIGFLSGIAGVLQLELFSQGVARNICAIALKRADQALLVGGALDVRLRERLHIGDGAVHLPEPEDRQEIR